MKANREQGYVISTSLGRLNDFGYVNSQESIYNCDETGFAGHEIGTEKVLIDG